MFFSEYIGQIEKALRTIDRPPVYALSLALQRARETGATVFTCGNGGSYSNAQHLAQDLCKGAALKTYHLGGNPSDLTARANDDGYACAFSGDLEDRGGEGDILIAISGSGNSANVLNAVNMAHELGMGTWGITGFDGGQLLHRAHRCIHVQCDDMGMVEAAHGVLFHWLMDALNKTDDIPNAAPVWSGVEIR